MINHVFSAELAAERRRDLLARADAYRLAKPVPGPRKANWLRVKIRTLRPSDGTLVTDVFEGMGPQSRLARFLTPKPRIDERQLHRITGDDERRRGVVALSRWSGRGVGLAEFIRDRQDPTVAEICAAVTDEWQSQGLGTRLAHALADAARREGVVAFTALTASGNIRARQVLAGLGDVRVIERDGATITYRVALHGAATPSDPGSASLVGTVRRWWEHAQLGPVANYVTR